VCALGGLLQGDVPALGYAGQVRELGPAPGFAGRVCEYPFSLPSPTTVYCCSGSLDFILISSLTAPFLLGWCIVTPRPWRPRRLRRAHAPLPLLACLLGNVELEYIQNGQWQLQGLPLLFRPLLPYHSLCNRRSPILCKPCMHISAALIGSMQ
jgi:hypothetical protein